VDRYSLDVENSHLLPHAGLSRRSITRHSAAASGALTSYAIIARNAATLAALAAIVGLSRF